MSDTTTVLFCTKDDQLPLTYSRGFIASGIEAQCCILPRLLPEIIEELSPDALIFDSNSISALTETLIAQLKDLVNTLGSQVVLIEGSISESRELEPNAASLASHTLEGIPSQAEVEEVIEQISIERQYFLNEIRTLTLIEKQFEHHNTVISEMLQRLEKHDIDWLENMQTELVEPIALMQQTINELEANDYILEQQTILASKIAKIRAIADILSSWEQQRGGERELQKTSVNLLGLIMSLTNDSLKQLANGIKLDTGTIDPKARVTIDTRRFRHLARLTIAIIAYRLSPCTVSIEASVRDGQLKCAFNISSKESIAGPVFAAEPDFQQSLAMIKLSHLGGTQEELQLSDFETRIEIILPVN